MKKIKFLFITLFLMLFSIGTAKAITITATWAGPVIDSVQFAELSNKLGYNNGFQRWILTTNSGSAFQPVQVKIYPVGEWSQTRPVLINKGTNMIRFQAYAGYNANTNETTIGVSTGLNASIRLENNQQITCYPYTAGSVTSFECPIAETMQEINVSFILFQFTPSMLGAYQFGVSDVFQLFNDESQAQQEANSKLDGINGAINSSNNKLDGIDGAINSSNTSGGESAADDLKNNSAFQDNSGLSSVVSMPLTFVNSLSNTCKPISLNIPYFDVDMQIPCLQSIITEKMPAFANIIKVVINGFIIYRVLLDIFQIIRNAKNPDDDRIEVLDL